MRLLPVLDLRRGLVVHARGGRRKNYQPLSSCWSAQAHYPNQLAQALHSKLGCTSLYVADLDALEGRPDQHDLIASLVQSGLKLWLDAGIPSAEQVCQWLACGVERVIVASETLPSLTVLAEIAQCFDHRRIIVSLDFIEGRFRIPFEIGLHDLVVCGSSLGLLNYILLDTAHVGGNDGPWGLKLCLELKRRYPSLFLITGGGVRHREDLDLLAQADVDVVLVATALHEGRLKSDDLLKYPFV